MIKRLLHKTALGFERIMDRMRPATGESRVIDPYFGYATGDQLIVRGRVLTARRSHAAREHDGWFVNLRRMVSLFLTDEVADVRVLSEGIEAVTDEEGYFTLVLPRPDLSGWVDVPVQIEGRDEATICPALVPAPDAAFMVISDVDDTVLQTGAYSIVRNLWTSLTGNVLSRRIYPDAVRLLSDLSQGGVNPVFYVSSSPWNLHGFLAEIFDRNGLVRGPMFLRDLGLSETKFITEGHGNHKGASIATLLGAMPDLPVILIGDTGQKDSAIYAQVVRENPDRVSAVVLREADDGSDARDLEPMARMEAAGCKLFHGRNFPDSGAVRAAVES